MLAMNMLDYNYAHFSLGPLFAGMIGVALAAANKPNVNIHAPLRSPAA